MKFTLDKEKRDSEVWLEWDDARRDLAESAVPLADEPDPSD